MPELNFSRLHLSSQFSDRHLCKLFAHQFMYGAREVLIDYMNLSFDNLFCGVLQHGVGAPSELWNNFPSPRLNLKRSPIWLASEKGKTYLQEQGVKRVYAIGSAWTYFLHTLEKKSKSLKTVSKESKERDILFFPDHGAWNITPQYKRLSIHHTLSIVRRNFPNDKITVCVYFTEYLSEDWHKIAHDYEMEVVCAGSGVTTPDWSITSGRILFFDRLKEFFSQHHVALFQSYTSAIFYALSLGLPVMILRGEKNAPFEHSLKDTTELIGMFPEIAENFTADKKLTEYSHEILGTESKLDPESLNSLLKPRKIEMLSQEYNGYQRDFLLN